MIHGHGDDIGQYKGAIRANFSSNVWYGGLNPGLAAHLQDKIALLTHYPDPDAEALQQTAAVSYGLHPDQVLVTNGATEAIYLIAQAYRDRTATIFSPTFSEYGDACRLQGIGIQLRSGETANSNQKFDTDLVFICNPNNPTGDAFATDLLRQFLQDNPDPLFVIDESYIEFTDATQSLLPRLATYPNLLILRSLTKSCCIPGLRLGFALGRADRIRTLRDLKMPWSVNRLAIEAGRYIFDHPQQFTLPLTQLLAATADWRRQLQQATDWRIRHTDTHYFLVETTAPFTAAALKLWLIREYGVLIRDASNFPGLTPYHFRVACQSPDHNQLLTDALRQCSRTGI
ncbi:MAG TPA: aminotransferase class I/II-fold pyridoxal phosphate-dependent enzyme [Puia sp.]